MNNKTTEETTPWSVMGVFARRVECFVHRN